VAFTARSRALSHAPLAVRDAADEVVRVAASAEVALVFGNETYGLSNDEVMSCNRTATIPTDPSSSSLNLAAAVQVAAYEVRLAALAGTPAEARHGEFAGHEEVERFYAHLEQSILESGFLQPDNPRRLMERMRRLFGRAGLEKEEINIWRGMLAAWDVNSRKARRNNNNGGGGNS
jgi:tRNA/rRNA methyltransferase